MVKRNMQLQKLEESELGHFRNRNWLYLDFGYIASFGSDSVFGAAGLVELRF